MSARAEMVTAHLETRGIDDPRILDAFRAVPREEFVPANLAEFAYQDTPLPIGDGQTISQPYIVALTIAALGLRGGERVLEIGTGSGYAAALLACIAGQVYTVERIAALADVARTRLQRLGYGNVEVRCGDGSLGWAEHAPYDAIAVAAGGPKVPEALVAQLAIGGTLVIPVGPDAASQQLVRVTRQSATRVREEVLADVRFVPLIGEQGWAERPEVLPAPRRTRGTAVTRLLHEVAEPFDDLDGASIDGLLDRIGDARVVLLGEATHGTSEFYRFRARITQALIARGGFSFVAAEADWPDAASYVVGFGTDHGTVGAASNWDEPMQVMRVRPACEGSYERLFHEAAIPAFLLHLRAPRRAAIRDELTEARLERAIGVVYRPETERASHYFQAILPHQFDEYVWIDETRAVRPLPVEATAPSGDLPDTYPFGV